MGHLVNHTWADSGFSLSAHVCPSLQSYCYAVA